MAGAEVAAKKPRRKRETAAQREAYARGYEQGREEGGPGLIGAVALYGLGAVCGAVVAIIGALWLA